IVRIKETGSSVAMSLDGNQRYCSLSPREGAKLIVAEGCRNLACVGAAPVAATNNLNFGNPERPEIMAQLVEAIEGMAEACRFFETPITGGNVSLYNETLGEGIFPSPVMGIVGLLKTAQPVGSAFRQAGCDVILLGGYGRCDGRQFGGTQYAKTILRQLWGTPPALDMDYEKRVQAAMRQIVEAELAESAHDVSDGGLAVCLAEASFGGWGAAIDLDSKLRPEFLLFHEGPSRIAISTRKPEQVARIAAKLEVEAPRIGVTINGALRIASGDTVFVNCELTRLRERWERALEDLLHPV
ncbi:MAG: AIR synthase related protein, partial [Bryobacteraceae bacterium]